jgi:hypothetical protein
MWEYHKRHHCSLVIAKSPIVGCEYLTTFGGGDDEMILDRTGSTAHHSGN